MDSGNDRWVKSGGCQLLLTPSGSAGTPHGADVGDVTKKHLRPERLLKPGVMAEDHHRRSPVKSQIQLVGPAGQQFVGIGETVPSEKRGAGVADADVISKLLRHWHQFLGDMDSTEYEHSGSWGDALDVYLVGAVFQGQTQTTVEKPGRVG